MKSLKIMTLFAAIVLITHAAMAQKANDVPPAVLSSFSAKYPQARLKKWKTDKTIFETGKGIFTAVFIMDDKKQEASYSRDGNWLNTVRNIKRYQNLPDEIKMYLRKSKYASWHIEKMQRLTTPSENIYRVEVDNGSGNKVLYEDAGSFEDKMLCFNDQGELIKTIVIY